MRERRARGALLVPLALALGLGCATRSHEPERLLEQGRLELETHKFEPAYEHLTRIRTHYPRSPENPEAFDLAARAFQGLYFRNRSKPDSPWVHEAPSFMLEWLGTFFEGDRFPQRHVEALVHGMPYAFLAEYQAFAAAHPAMARWRVRATRDNGLIDSLTAERADSAQGSTS